ncbi:MAG TPA: cation-transporting P-type ATPase [Candidatus Saccharimonadales bacterium]
MDKEKAKSLNVNEFMSELQASDDGLSEREVTDRLEKYGPNVFKTETKNHATKLLLKQFKSSLVYLLLAAAIISFAVKDVDDGIVITVILLLNTGLGFFQEYRSEKAVEKLQKLIGKEILVTRDGRQHLVPEKQLTIGDLVTLKEGDVVPADVRLISADDLTVNESQLSGESVPVGKLTVGKNCLVFAGSTIEEGEGLGVVYAVGLATELGKIAHLSSSTKRVTQFEKSLSAFSSFLVKVTFLTLLAIFILKLVTSHSGESFSELALFAIALSITVVPEAMPVIVTVTLSRGALSLAKRHVITKTLTAVEDLGNINVLCSDKTGTLTENKQTIKKIFTSDEELFQTLAMVSLENLDAKHIKLQSSFDKAFIDYIPKDIQEKAKSFRRLKELPFDPASRRRRVVATKDGKTYLIEVGSTETLLDLTHSSKAHEYRNIIKSDGRQGLRHLGIAYKEIEYESDAFDILEHEKGLKFVGFCSLEDPLRPNAKATIRLAENLGVDIKILSGDSREVTQYVAEEVGLIEKGQTVYTGDEIEQMSDIKLAEELKTIHALARLNPEQKYRVIRLLQLHGNVVGYQGDGINDAPALKLADVAIAVSNATDVAQESADILLLRNDIEVLVNGIKYGREIFANINKYIRFMLVGNWGNFFALSALYLLSVNGLPILTVQLLLTSLLTDLPCVAIATDNVDKQDLSSPSKFSIHSLMFISIFLGSLTAVFEIMYYAVIKSHAGGVASTGLFLFLTFSGLIIIFAIRTKDHFWRAPKFSAAMKIVFALVAVISLALVYIPTTKRVLHFSSFTPGLFGIMLVLTLIYFFVIDTVKVWFYKTPIGKSL